jgi:hypothetical protein
MEFIPTRINVNCVAEGRKGDQVVLPYNGYPVINGEVDRDCVHWVKRIFKKEASSC